MTSDLRCADHYHRERRENAFEYADGTDAVTSLNQVQGGLWHSDTGMLQQVLS